MRRFDAEYLRSTRAGMWADDRSALDSLDLAERDSILDVGAGTGVLTRVLRAESSGRVIALDADHALLDRVAPPRIAGDALRLPFLDASIALVACQALLVNLPDPTAALTEWARVASDHVAAIEPDNAAVRVESTVDGEAALAERARARYLAGVETDAGLGADAADHFEAAGLDVVGRARYDHVLRVAPPYDDRAVEAARRKATGAGLAVDRSTILAGPTDEATYEALEREWRTMGRAVIDQMADRRYERTERIPFHVTVGRVP
ncbi:class I SAM-dependent methyltransferase [Halococcoides cellulosivorans]|uniref:SAM-dependent methyltransferase n=1 Tax=Halococcoides cellulosivorans TaxID=1679096 RepID=A0A2R4X496_9EURY|nr:SAM-dependent methyltransferase [Halococcoides cellulosivorans]